jgi:hypothetical protein
VAVPEPRAPPGTARLHVERFPSGRAQLSLTLVTERVRDQYNVGTMTRRTPVGALAPEDWLESRPSTPTRSASRTASSRA